MKKVYYNDNDKGSCAWLRELIKNGLIPDGDVDDRSILEVKGDDVRGYTQAHFFAGIGGWVHALALSGWPRDRRIWTGSCPCQPFSCAGKGKGEKDKRHLWPEFRRLIKECCPPEVFGEQVASKAGRIWLSRVRVDLEEMGYAVGAADLCAAGVGSPHIRQRLYWAARHDGLANSEHDGRRADLEGRGQEGRASDGWSGEASRGRRDAEQRIEDGGLANSSGQRIRTGHGSCVGASEGTEGLGTERERVRLDAGDGIDAGGMADSDRERRVGQYALLREEGQERGSKEVPQASRSGKDCGVANSERSERRTDDEHGRVHGGRTEDPSGPRGRGEDGGMANAEGSGGRSERGAMEGVPRQEPEGEQQRRASRAELSSGSATRRFTNWDDSKWHECQDNRKRRIPTEPSIFALATRISIGLGDLWRESLQEVDERNKVSNGASKETRPPEGMLSVRDNSPEEEKQRNARGYGSISEEKVLRQKMYVTGLLENENPVSESEQKTGTQTCGTSMLEMRGSNDKDACSSCGRKSHEQLSRELKDTLFILSQEASSASVEGCPSAALLSVLYETCKKKGDVSDALSVLEEVWRSIHNKEKAKWDIEQLFYCTKRIMKYSLFPMAHGLPSGRVGLLRGAGNAICPEIAAEFVMAYMEAVNEL